MTARVFQPGLDAGPPSELTKLGAAALEMPGESVLSTGLPRSGRPRLRHGRSMMIIACLALATAPPGIAVAAPLVTAGIGIHHDAEVVRDYYQQHPYQRHEFGGMYLLHDPSRLVVMVTDDPLARPYPWEADLLNPDRLRLRSVEFSERHLLKVYRQLNQDVDEPWMRGSTGFGVDTKRNRVVVYFLTGEAPKGFAAHEDMDVIVIRKKGYDQGAG